MKPSRQKEREEAAADIDGLERAIAKIVSTEAQMRARRVIALARFGLAAKFNN